MKYTLQDFNDIAFSGYDYKLPEIVLNKIKNLITELGITANSKPTTETRSADSTDSKYKKNNYFSNSKKNKNYVKRDNVDDPWETAKPFKATKIDKKEGMDKLINDIRACLNKISNKNYETQRDIIFEQIDKIILKFDTFNTSINLSMLSLSFYIAISYRQCNCNTNIFIISI